MEKKICLLFASLLLAAFVNAKDQVTISLSGKSLENQDYGFKIVEVVDATSGRKIGEAHVGPLNKTVPIFTQRTLQEELQGLFDRHEWNQTGGEKGLILKVNKVWLSEILEPAAGHAIAELNVSFIERGPRQNEYTELFQAAVVVLQDGMDMADRHDEGLLFAIYESLKDFKERKTEGKLDPKQVELPASPANTIRRVHSLDFPQGVFSSYYDFRDGAIQQKNDLKYRYKTTKTGNLLWADIKTENGLDTGSYWGFSDGDQVFVLYGQHYYPLRMVPLTEDIVLHAPAQANIEGSLLSGLTVGAVGGAVDMTANLVNPRYLDYMLDEATGKFMPYEDWEEEFAPATVHFYTTELEGEIEYLNISLNGDPVCQLNDNEYIDVLARPREKENEVCVTDENGHRECEKFIFDYGGNYVILCNMKNKRKPQVELLQMADSEFILSEIERGNLEQGCM